MSSIKKTFYAVDQTGSIRESREVKKKLEKKKQSPLIYFNVGYYLIIPILGGLALGLVIDDWIKTKPVFTVFFLLLGTIGSFYNLFTLQRK